MIKNRICHFTCAHEADDVRVFQKECVSLAKAGFEVYLVVPNAKSELVDGVHIVGVPSPSMNPIYRLFFLSRRVYRETCKIDADLYQFHDIELFRYGLKLKRRGKKVVFDSHENWIGYAEGIQWLPKWAKHLVKKYLVRQYSRYLKYFDRALSVSPHISTILSKYSGRVELVMNYPIIEANGLLDISDSNYIQRPNNVCYAGTVYEFSLQENIVKAITSISDLKYLIIGNITEGYKEKIIREDVNGQVVFVNYVDKNTLRSYYQNSIIGFALFDYVSNLGGKVGSLGVNKIFEYMAMGLPIICTDFDLWKDIVKKYDCGLCVNPHSINEIQSAVRFLLDNKLAAYNMGRNGQKAVLAEFNWDVERDKYIGIVKSILDN